MLLLGVETPSDPVQSIWLELQTLKIIAPPLAFQFSAPFSLVRDGSTFDFDPVSQQGEVSILRSLIKSSPTLAEQQDKRFMLQFDDGCEIICAYQSAWEHVAVWGPEPDMFTALPE